MKHDRKTTTKSRLTACAFRTDQPGIDELKNEIAQFRVIVDVRLVRVENEGTACCQTWCNG